MQFFFDYENILSMSHCITNQVILHNTMKVTTIAIATLAAPQCQTGRRSRLWYGTFTVADSGFLDFGTIESLELIISGE